MAAPELDDLVRLAEYSSDLDAQIDAASLRSAGIATEVRNNGSYMPMPGFGISLYVFAGDMVEAQALLALSQPTDPASSEQPDATWRRSQTYVYVRLAMRIGLALYVLLAIYSFIIR